MAYTRVESRSGGSKGSARERLDHGPVATCAAVGRRNCATVPSAVDVDLATKSRTTFKNTQADISRRSPVGISLTSQTYNERLR